MKRITVLLLLICCYTGFSQKPATTPAITRYRVMNGVIDKYPVTFHLYRNNNEISGHYYYDNTCLPISLSGILGKDKFLKLTHSADNENDNESLDGVFTDSVYSGTWTYKGKMLNFRVAQKKDNGGLQFDYICASGEKKIPKKPEEYGPDELSWEAATVWPTAGSHGAAADTVRQFIRGIFFEKNSTEEIGKILLRRKNEFLGQKNSSHEEITDYSTSDDIQVEFNNQRLLSLSHANYSFSGGAHGNYGTSYTCFDLVNAHKLELYDVLDTLAGRAVIEKILEKKFRATYTSMIDKDQPLNEVLSVERIPVNDNFLLTAKGIAFNYVPYEIAAYALGGIFLYIPFKEIDPLLKPEFKKLLQ
jgi:Deacetylase PdaC/Protein of unknown function (DUF3298)